MALDWTGLRVLEIGSADINGSIRSFFPGSDYTGVDLSAGPGVDVVASGHELALPDRDVDLAISCECFEHNPLVLHVSLRDLAPEILLDATNIVDDVDHCLKADTSPHLVEQLTGSRDFLDGTLADVMTGRVAVPHDRPVIFSPFGLGVLDLAVGHFVYRQVARSGELQVVDEFFSELRRHG